MASSISKDDAVKTLREKINSIEHIKNINTDDEYLLRFLYSTDFDVEIAFNRMKLYHEVMVDHPHWYQKDSPLQKKSIMDTCAAIMIPETDKNGRPIYISKIKNLDPDKSSFADEACIDDIWYEYILDKHPEIAGKGICMIIDFEGITWKFMKLLNYKDVKISFRRLASLPFKQFQVHVVNKSRYMKTMLKIVQPFIPDESKKQLHFHFDDLDSLYEHIEKDNLPPEYGGYNKINHKQIYEKLYEKSEMIHNKFRLYRNVIKS